MLVQVHAVFELNAKYRAQSSILLAIDLARVEREQKTDEKYYAYASAIKWELELAIAIQSFSFCSSLFYYILCCGCFCVEMWMCAWIAALSVFVCWTADNNSFSYNDELPCILFFAFFLERESCSFIRWSSEAFCLAFAYGSFGIQCCCYSVRLFSNNCTNISEQPITIHLQKCTHWEKERKIEYRNW